LKSLKSVIVKILVCFSSLQNLNVLSFGLELDLGYPNLWQFFWMFYSNKGSSSFGPSSSTFTFIFSFVNLHLPPSSSETSTCLDKMGHFWNFECRFCPRTIHRSARLGCRGRQRRDSPKTMRRLRGKSSSLSSPSKKAFPCRSRRVWWTASGNSSCVFVCSRE